MDIFAHTLWTGALFYPKYRNRRKHLLAAIAFGIVPDLISFAPATIYLFFSNRQVGLEQFLDRSIWVFRYASDSYNYTHSLVICLAAIIIAAAIRKGKIYWPMLGWVLHIGIDIFTHKGFYETPFLFPLSGFRNHYAIPWSHPLFMLINYAVMAAAYLALYFIYGRKAKSKQA